jgi:hypothetical protein
VVQDRGEAALIKEEIREETVREVRSRSLKYSTARVE